MEKEKIEKYNLNQILGKVFIVIAVAFLIISVWGLYSSLNDLIRIWVGYKYAPIYRSFLNLAVVILAIYIIHLLVRKK